MANKRRSDSEVGEEVAAQANEKKTEGRKILKARGVKGRTEAVEAEDVPGVTGGNAVVKALGPGRTLLNVLIAAGLRARPELWPG